VPSPGQKKNVFWKLTVCDWCPLRTNQWRKGPTDNQSGIRFPRPH